MPMVRLVCVIALFVWKIWLKRPVGLWLFIVLDESTRIINLSVAKPVRESLWRGLSNEGEEIRGANDDNKERTTTTRSEDNASLFILTRRYAPRSSVRGETAC